MTEQKHKESRPWLTFTLEAERFPYHFWRLLGECVSKFDHLKNIPLSDQLIDKIMQVYLRKGAAATTAIEGNPLSEEQVGEIIAGNAPPPSKYHQPLHTQILNVTALFNEITEKAQRAPLPPLTPARLCNFQQKILANLDVDGNIGKIRERGVVVGGYQGAPHQSCAHLLEELCRWLQEGRVFRKVEAEMCAATAAILRATLAHLYIAWIHPFNDGNGRTARMAEFYLLVQGGVPIPAAHLLANHCNNRRDEYYWQLNNATKTRSPIAFIGFLVGGLRDSLQEQLKEIHDEYETVFWGHVTRIAITKSTGLPAVRHRRIDLTGQLPTKRPVGLADLLRKPEIAILYAKTSGAALLQNDLEYLIKEKIVQKIGNGYMANKALLKYVNPPAAKPGK